MKKRGALFNYTKKVYTVVEKLQFPGDLWKYKLNGYTNRFFPSPVLLKVDLRGMVPLGTEKHKNDISFNTQYDREAQLKRLHANNRKQGLLSPEELDAQVLQIDKEKQKIASAQQSNLPDVPIRRSKRIQKSDKKVLPTTAQKVPKTIQKAQSKTAQKVSKTMAKGARKLVLGGRFTHDDDGLTYTIISINKRIGARNYKNIEYDFKRSYVKKRIKP